ncbi:MAG: hypothetical protein M3347_04965 [Armatimonadota bacterium]|nr:hypothetical protein [Armatimonadota bacterium]
MPSFSDDNSDNIRTAMGIFGALCVLGFLFSPLAGRWSSAGTSVYMVEGKGEQWGLILLAPATGFLVYRRLWGWATTAGSLLLLVALVTAWRCYQAAHPDPYSYYRGYSAYQLPAFIDWMALATGVVLLWAASIWGLWQERSERHANLIFAPGAHPRHFDPRSRNPQATFGFCSICGTKNPLTLSQCHQCHAPLAWATPRPQAAPVKPVPPSKPAGSREPWLATVDWGFWGIALVSFLFWPLGLLLFFSYSRNGDDKANAALIGAGVGLLLMALRFVALMAKVGS